MSLELCVSKSYLPTARVIYLVLCFTVITLHRDRISSAANLGSELSELCVDP
jgi:hypothetical protein